MLKSVQHVNFALIITYTDIKNGHEGPALHLPRVNRIILFASGTSLNLLTQINLNYKHY
jgi:hypothetical protein